MCKLNESLLDSLCTLHKPHPTAWHDGEGPQGPGGGEDPHHNSGGGTGQGWAAPEGHSAGARPACPHIVTSVGGWDQLPTFIIFFFPSPENQKAVQELVESQQKWIVMSQFQ